MYMYVYVPVYVHMYTSYTTYIKNIYILTFRDNYAHMHINRHKDTYTRICTKSIHKIQTHANIVLINIHIQTYAYKPMYANLLIANVDMLLLTRKAEARTGTYT